VTPILGRFLESIVYSMDVDDQPSPADLGQEVSLRDGGTLHLRPIRPDDTGRLIALHGRLSRDSIVMRFFSPMPVLTEERARYFTTLDFDRRLAIVAVEGTGDDEQIVGVGRYDRSDETSAEFALIVEDRLQHHGIGSVLFWALVRAARARGLTTLTAEVLAENRRMLTFLRETGLPTKSRRAGTAIHLDLDLTSP
jgi:GNAT superfamily N-acetyltransferase